MELKISSPYIIKKNEDGKVRMYADMTIGNKTISPYFMELMENSKTSCLDRLHERFNALRCKLAHFILPKDF